ncbi:MAG: hypothetical protein WBF34_03915 [Streptosporangiaceae bacterium]|jgi:hypothetical protein
MPRAAAPSAFTAADRAEVIAPPAESGVPLPRRSGPDLARQLSARCQASVSASTIGRWLARDALKPWQHRSWISVRDPEFATGLPGCSTCAPVSGTPQEFESLILRQLLLARTSGPVHRSG